MNNVAVFPFTLPFFTAVTLLIWRKPSRWRRGFILASIFGQIILAAWLISEVFTKKTPVVLAIGAWTPPLGIVLVIDLLSAVMLLLSALMLFACVMFRYVSVSPQIEHPLRQPLVQFMVAGINLTFITGDLFNLFVAFEIMLIASYALLTLEADDWDVKQAFPYLSINLVGSALFLVAVGFAYSVFGTLNIADIARLSAGMEGDPRVTFLGLMLAMVFGIKAGIFPMYYWLPNSYPILSSSLAALFSGMLTKVGVYVLLRTFCTMLPHSLDGVMLFLAWAGSLTMVFGVFGAISRNFVRGILSYHILSQIGYMVLAIGLFTPVAIGACIFYIVHHILVKGTLFLIGGTVSALSGTDYLKKTGGLWKATPILGVCFLLQALSLAGVPPLSGFWGKLIIFMEGLRLGEQGGGVVYFVFVGAGVVAGILTLYSMLKIWNDVFWKRPPDGAEPDLVDPRWKWMTWVVLFFCLLSLGIGLGAEGVWQVAYRAAEMAMDQETYIRAVLEIQGKGVAP